MMKISFCQDTSVNPNKIIISDYHRKSGSIYLPGAVLVPEVCPGRPAPRDGAVTALQLEEDGDRLVRVRVEVEHGGAAAQELREKKET